MFDVKVMGSSFGLEVVLDCDDQEHIDDFIDGFVVTSFERS